jgi:succinoglycan biosynthesis transport protein ExoP
MNDRLVQPAAKDGVASGSSSTHAHSGGPRQGGHSYTIESEIHLLDRIAVLYRYRIIATTVFILTTLGVMIQGYTTVQVYRAQARLLIEDERSTAIPGVTTAENTYYEDPEPYYQTQYKILQGRDLIRKVVQKLHLENVPEFNGTAPPPPTPMTLVRDLQRRLFSLISSSSAPAEGEQANADEAPDESNFVSAFAGRVDVQQVRGSRLVDVFFVSRDPQFAALAANVLAEEYVQQNLQVKLGTTQSMIEFLDKEVAHQQKKVEDTERALADYRDRQNAMSLDDKQNIVLSRLNALNDSVTKAKTARVQRESIYNQVKAIPPGTSLDSIAVVSQNVTVQNAKARRDDALRERQKEAEKHGEKHPDYIKADGALKETQRLYDLEMQRALTTVQQEYQSAVIEESTLNRALEGAKADAQDLGHKSVNYNVMEREAKSNRQVYESLLQRENELRVAANSHSNNVRIIDRAEVPKSPMTPGGKRTWLIAFAMGLMLAVGVAFGLDYMNDTIKTPEDVTRRLNLPFLGLVPSVRGDKHPVLASSHVPHDFGEAFRALRTSLVAKYPSEGTKIMLVTSAQPLEGKTTTAANIGMALAYGGARVLLVDADMRRPGLHRPLRLTNERGLSQVLIGQARVRDVIQRTVDPNLLAITAGRTPPNPSELLASERMKTLLTNLSHGPFDWIVIDTPPVLAVTDAVILAPVVSGVTFVVGAEMTRRRLAERAVETIMQTRPKFAAVVLNKVDFARNKYYYSRYYGHQYKNYYAEAAV